MKLHFGRRRHINMLFKFFSRNIASFSKYVRCVGQAFAAALQAPLLLARPVRVTRVGRPRILLHGDVLERRGVELDLVAGVDLGL
jgi:hypothetical protein